MSGTLEREQAEALQMIDALRLELPGEVWGDVKRIVLALVERAEKFEREAVAAKAETAYVRSTEWWDSRMSQANACIAAFNALRERERELTASIALHEEAHELYVRNISQEYGLRIKAEERERELTALLKEWRDLGYVTGGGYGGTIELRTDALLA